MRFVNNECLASVIHFREVTGCRVEPKEPLRAMILANHQACRRIGKLVNGECSVSSGPRPAIENFKRRPPVEERKSCELSVFGADLWDLLVRCSATRRRTGGPQAAAEELQFVDLFNG